MTTGTLIFYIFHFRDYIRNPLEVFRRLIIALLFTALCTSFLPAADAAWTPDTSADAAILVEAAEGTVLYEKKADNPMLIASTTKILTALIALENCDVNEKVVIQKDFPYVIGSSIYLKPGEELTVLELLYGLLLASGNDAAVALALHVSGSVEAFSALMNDYAKTLGCKHSHFANPHGLDAEGHYSSARDLSIIAAAAMKNKTFCDIVSTKRISVAGRSFRNHNKLLWNCPGAIGIKTGFTESAGRSLVSCTERGGMRLICVTLSAPNDWKDHTTLYDWAFREFACVKITKDDRQTADIPVISGIKDHVLVHPSENFIYVYSRSEPIKLCYDLPRFLYAPAEQNKKAGTILIKKNGKTIKQIPLVCSETVGLDKSIPLTFFEKLKWSMTRK